MSENQPSIYPADFVIPKRFFLTLLFSITFFFSGVHAFSQVVDSVQVADLDTLQTDQVATPDTIQAKQVADTTTKSEFVKKIQEAGYQEYLKSQSKLSDRKIYIRQHELIEALKNENFHVKGLINKGIEYAEIKAKMATFQELMPKIIHEVQLEKSEFLTERDLTVSSAIFREMLGELEDEKEKVDQYANAVRRSQYRLDSLGAEQDLYIFPSDSLQTRQYAYLLIEIGKETKPVDDTLASFSGKLDSLQTSLNEMVFNLTTEIESLELTRQNLNRGILKAEIPTNPDAPYYTRTLTEAISYSHTKEKIALFFYLKLYSTRLLVMSLLILIVWIFLKSLRDRTEKLNELDSHDDGKLVLKNPLLSSVVIVVGFFQFFFPNPPFVFYWFVWLISSLALTLIFFNYLSRFWLLFWVFTVLVFLISGSLNMILLPTVTERNLLIGVSLIGIAFLGFTFFKNRNQQLKERRIAYFIYFMGVFELISLLLNVSGRFNLSKSFLVSGYIGIVVGILLLWTVRLINQGLAIATKIYHNQEKELFFINFDRLGNKAPGIFYAFLTFGWVILVGKNFYSFSQLSLGISEFMNEERMLGSYKFSINGLFVFLIILFVSVLISRLLSIFSADPDSSTSQDQRKRISFGSWLLLVQIFVISLGLFLAFAASGIPLDKITIILGALSVGIGLGLQGLVNNLVSGLIIAFENTLKVGDLIEIEGRPGIMKSIGFRSSVVNMFEGSTVVIPNGDLISKQLINWTTGKGRKLSVIIGVSYSSDLNKALELLRGIISEDSRIRILPPPRVVPLEFADSSIDIEVVFWVNNYLDYPFVKGDFLSKANMLFKENGITIPFPQRDLYLKTVPDEMIGKPSKKDDNPQNLNQG